MTGSSQRTTGMPSASFVPASPSNESPLAGLRRGMSGMFSVTSPPATATRCSALGPMLEGCPAPGGLARTFQVPFTAGFKL